MQNIIKMPFLSACVLTFLIIKKFKRDKNKKVKKTFLRVWSGTVAGGRRRQAGLADCGCS